MATDIENSSCSSSLIDSGFESSSAPKPPPRKKRSKSTWSLVRDDEEQEKIVEKKSSSKNFSRFLKTFGPSAKEKLKQSWWTLVIHINMRGKSDVISLSTLA
jgi:CCR4-NOT transcriptional regulation complex NOT5 subunit